ncbi:MAG: hypothetical protein R3F10_03485 [Lysobacteraceae bacterium]
MNSPQTREEWIALAAKYHRLLGELVHHVEQGRIVSTPRKGYWSHAVGVFLESCFVAVEDTPFGLDPDSAELVREESAETLAAIRRIGGAP